MRYLSLIALLFSFLSVFFVYNMSYTYALSGKGEAECLAQGGKVVGTLCLPTKQKTDLPDKKIPAILAKISDWIAYVFGSLAIITFIICGFQYLLAAGDDTQAENAKRCMKWAIIGVATAGSAMVVMRVLESLINASWSPFSWSMVLPGL